MTQHEQIVAAYESYIAENEKFTSKGVKAAAARARKALQEMGKGIKERRKEITAEKEAIGHSRKMIVKDSQLHQTEWPLALTPEQREQLIREKFARLTAWYQHSKKTNDHNDQKNCECS